MYDKDFKRTFIHVKDIVRAYIFGLENFDAMKNEIYNVGSESMNKTKEEIALMIREKINFELYFADKGIPDPDMRDYEVSYKKLNGKGYKTSITFEQGIDELAKGLQTVTINNPFVNI